MIFKNKKTQGCPAILCAALVLAGLSAWCFAGITFARAQEPTFPETEWDGHVKLHTRALFPRSDTPYQTVGLSPDYDGYGELRLNNKTFFADTFYMEVNYESLAGGGDTRKTGQTFKQRLPDIYPDGLFSPVAFFGFTTCHRRFHNQKPSHI